MIFETVEKATPKSYLYYTTQMILLFYTYFLLFLMFSFCLGSLLLFFQQASICSSSSIIIFLQSRVVSCTGTLLRDPIEKNKTPNLRIRIFRNSVSNENALVLVLRYVSSRSSPGKVRNRLRKCERKFDGIV